MKPSLDINSKHNDRLSILFRQENLSMLGKENLYNQQMDIKNWIIASRKNAGITQDQLAESLGVTRGNVSAWENGRHELSVSQINKIADICKADHSSLFVDKYTNTKLDNNVEAGPDIKGQIPLISWVQAGSFTEVIDNFQPGDAEQWLPSLTHMSKSSFALRVRGISMEPKFQDGDLIYVDPEIAPDSGRYVIVRLDDEKEVTFKQLVIEDGQKFLRPLNPSWDPQLIKINGNATICGVVVGKLVTF